MAVFVLKHRSYINSLSISLLRRGLLLLRIDDRLLLLLLLLLEELDRAVEHQHSHRQHHEAGQLQPRPLRQALSKPTPQRSPSPLLRPEVMNRHRRHPHQERSNRLHQIPHQRVRILRNLLLSISYQRHAHRAQIEHQQHHDGQHVQRQHRHAVLATLARSLRSYHMIRLSMKSSCRPWPSSPGSTLAIGSATQAVSRKPHTPSMPTTIVAGASMPCRRCSSALRRANKHYRSPFGGPGCPAR